MDFHQTVCALLLWRSGSGLLMDKFRSDQLEMCIDIVEIWFGIAFGYMSSIFDRVTEFDRDNGGVLLFHVSIFLRKIEIDISWKLSPEEVSVSVCNHIVICWISPESAKC